MKFFWNPYLLLVVGLLLVAIIVTPIIHWNSPVVNGGNSIISADVAVDRALASANADSPMGRLIGSPDEIQGKVMTYDQAHRLLFGRPVAPNTERGKMAANQVWLIVLHGNVIAHIEGAPGKTPIPASDEPHHQMAVILDAITADVFEGAIISNEKPLNVQSLPVLTLPKEPVEGIPRQLPIIPVTAAPLAPAPP
jgi:hypothetical protein